MPSYLREYQRSEQIHVANKISAACCFPGNPRLRQSCPLFDLLRDARCMLWLGRSGFPVRAAGIDV